jgi:hypothetical protein
MYKSKIRHQFMVAGFAFTFKNNPKVTSVQG